MTKHFYFLWIIIFFVLPLRSDELLTGLYFHDSSNIFSGNKVERGIDFGAEIIFGEGVLRPDLGMTINSAGETSRFYSGFVAEGDYSNLFARFGLGGAFQINAVRNLGSSLLFRICLEFGYSFKHHAISLTLDHISNAGLADHNAGLDLLGLRYGFKF